MTGEVYDDIIYNRTSKKRGDEAMSMTSDMIRGHTDPILLAHLLKHDSYGYEINKAIQLATEGQYELKEATLYTAFRRLEQAGYITSYWGNETTGARRRYYAITPAGRSTHKKLVEDWNSAKLTIDKLINTNGEESL